MTHRVLVYGSLRKGLHNHHLLGNSKYVGDTDEVLGKMYSLRHYPFVVLEGKTKITCECYEVLDETLATLDRLEGHPGFYFRTPVTVPLLGECNIYAMPEGSVYDAKGKAGEFPLVSTGDWKQWQHNDI